MNKELTPLEALKYMVSNERFCEPTCEEEQYKKEKCIEIIENALKDYEKLEESLGFDPTIFKQDFETLMKEHKALEIIKESVIDNIDMILWEHNVYGKGIVYYCLSKEITKKQYELVKEVLL